MIAKFIKLFESKLELALNEKTSWGRNDLKLVIKTVLAETLAEMVA